MLKGFYSWPKLFVITFYTIMILFVRLLQNSWIQTYTNIYCGNLITMNVHKSKHSKEKNRGEFVMISYFWRSCQSSRCIYQFLINLLTKKYNYWINAWKQISTDGLKRALMIVNDTSIPKPDERQWDQIILKHIDNHDYKNQPLSFTWDETEHF